MTEGSEVREVVELKKKKVRAVAGEAKVNNDKSKNEMRDVGTRYDWLLVVLEKRKRQQKTVGGAQQGVWGKRVSL